MAFIDAWTECHLTPLGWVEGSSKEDDGETSYVSAPKDRVLTGRWSIYQGHSMAKRAHPTFMVEWRHHDEQLVKRLVQKYGERPKY